MYKHLRFFYSSFIVTILGFILGVFFIDNHLNLFNIIYLITVLILLEISFSFDNAVINAKILENMSDFWRKIFIWIGLPIAVFGMRLIFPVLLVSISTNLSFYSVLELAIHYPDKYHQILIDVLPIIASFGGSFLFMVFLTFFFDKEKNIHWITFLENSKITKYIKNIYQIEILISVTIGVFICTYSWLLNIEIYYIFIAYFTGILIHEILRLLMKLFNGNSNNSFLKTGLMNFIYLEILDASFSFDGVIGAFAITTDIFIIMIGLGVGAMYVRSLTLYMVEYKTLNTLKYLEHGAHYAIGFLAVVMFCKVLNIHISEWIVGGFSIFLIISAVIYSIKFNQKKLLSQ